MAQLCRLAGCRETRKVLKVLRNSSNTSEVLLGSWDHKLKHVGRIKVAFLIFWSVAGVSQSLFTARGLVSFLTTVSLLSVCLAVVWAWCGTWSPSSSCAVVASSNRPSLTGHSSFHPAVNSTCSVIPTWSDKGSDSSVSPGPKAQSVFIYYFSKQFGSLWSGTTVSEGNRKRVNLCTDCCCLILDQYEWNEITDVKKFLGVGPF